MEDTFIAMDEDFWTYQLYLIQSTTVYHLPIQDQISQWMKKQLMMPGTMLIRVVDKAASVKGAWLWNNPLEKIKDWVKDYASS